jgi:peptidyl-prolyl cis-trans isomerase A (cyclophilin A)
MLGGMVRILLGLSLCALACSSGGSSGGTGGASGSGGTAGAAGSAGLDGGGGVGGSAGQAGSDAGQDSASVKPVVEIVTSLGTLVVELEPDKMPITTANFLSYVDSDFYAGTIFHRVIPDFMIQGGGFQPGLLPKATQPPIVLETHPDLKHVYGAISMARTTDPNSATSQFFIVNSQSGAPHLDGEYAAFGNLIEGAAVLDAISAVPTETQGAFENVPVDDVVINSATLR